MHVGLSVGLVVANGKAGKKFGFVLRAVWLVWLLGAWWSWSDFV